MIRPLTFLSLMAAAGAGLHLYGVKHEVSQLEKTLRETVKQTELARERTAVLRAEWALLNEPERLRAAATRNLPLDVMQTAQFVRPADLERRLPAVVAFAGAPSLFGPGGPRPGEAAVAAASPDTPSGSAPGTTPVAAAMMAAASAAARVAQAAVTPAAQAAPAAQVSVVPLPVPPRAPAGAAAATGGVQVASARPSAERMAERAAVVPAQASPARPAPERAPAMPVERVTLPPMQVAPTPVAPVPASPAQAALPRPPQQAASRLPEAPARQTEARSLDARPIEPRPSEVKAPRALVSPPRPMERALDRPADIRMTARELDRGMNLTAPPQPAPLLRTVHLRPAAPAQAVVPGLLPSARAAEVPSALGAAYGAARPALAPPVPVARAATLDRAR